MPRFFCLSSVVFGMALVLAGSGHAQNEAPVPASVDSSAAIRTKLNAIVIPKVEFQNTSFREAVEFLKNTSHRLDTAEAATRGVNIIVKSPPPGQAAANSAVDPASVRLTLSLTNVPLYEALRYVAELSGLAVHIEPYAVILEPPSDVDALITKEYRAPKKFVTDKDAAPSGPAVEESLKRNGIDFPPGASAVYVMEGERLVVRNTQANLDLLDTFLSPDLGDSADPKAGLKGNLESNPKGYLERNGISFPTGASAKFIPADGRLVVRNTQRELNRIEALLGGGQSPTPSPNEKIEQKLGSILIPRIAFSNVSVAEAIAFLRESAQKLDQENESTKGVNLILQLPPRPADLMAQADPLSVDPAQVRISLNLTNVPLGEALHYIAELSGLKYRVDPHAVSIYPAWVVEPLLTKEFKID